MQLRRCFSFRLAHTSTPWSPTRTLTMSLHPFYKAIYGFSALHAVLITVVFGIVLTCLAVDDGLAVTNYQLRVFLVLGALRAISSVVFENILVTHSAVFRSMSAHDQRFLVMSLSQFTSLISWTGAGLLIALYTPFNTLASNQQMLHPLGVALSFAAIMDLCTDLYRNGGWDLYAHHAVALMMLIVSFEVLPVSMSDPGVIIYSVQNGLDRCVRLVFFWARMRRQQVALLVKDGELREKESTRNASLDDLIPSDDELKRQFTVAFVVYTFIIRFVMTAVIAIYLSTMWDEMVWGWRITHLALPILFALSDIKFFQYLYRKSNLARSGFSGAHKITKMRHAGSEAALCDIIKLG